MDSTLCMAVLALQQLNRKIFPVCPYSLATFQSPWGRLTFHLIRCTWRIIPVGTLLVTPFIISRLGRLEGGTTQLKGLTNHD